MSKADQTPSRHTNGNNSVTAADPGNSADLDDRELPTPSERAAEFYEAYSDLATMPLTEVEGRRLRERLVERDREEWESEPPLPWEDAVVGQETVATRPLTWMAAVEDLLESHEVTRKTWLNFERGKPSDGVEYGRCSIDADDRWMANYQKRYYAQMKGWLRELCGGERPSGGEAEASFEDPYIALITRSASSVPDGERLPPTDHDEALSGAWSDVYHTLRNTLRSQGFDLGDDWQYDRRQEPHVGERGGGLNHCYGHEHIVLVVDGAVAASDLAPVIEKHVEACEYAGESAHRNEPCAKHDNGNPWDDAVSECPDCKNVISVREESEIDNLANYVASYCGIQPTDLLERSVEYIGWAAVKHATNGRTLSRSDAAKHAATADACKQRYEDPETKQDENHGESVVRAKDGARHDYECLHCGSPHEIEQDHETLTAARLEAAESGAEAGETAAVADGGVDREQDLRGRWQDARAAARVGETPSEKKRRERIEEYLEQNPDAPPPRIIGALNLSPDAVRVIEEVRAGIDRTEVVGFERLPKWRLVSVEVGGEEYPASNGGGVEMAETDYGGTWRPPHDGSRECPACGEEAIVSAHEAEAVYHWDVEAAYICEDCRKELGPPDAPETPPQWSGTV